MLRFDIAPVCSNAYRLQALMSTTIAAIYLFTPYKWVAIFLAVGGFIRGFVSPHKCFSYKLFASITRKLNLSKMQNAGSKMFADHRRYRDVRDLAARFSGRHDPGLGHPDLRLHRSGDWFLCCLLGLRRLLQVQAGLNGIGRNESAGNRAFFC